MPFRSSIGPKDQVGYHRIQHLEEDTLDYLDHPDDAMKNSKNKIILNTIQ